MDKVMAFMLVVLTTFVTQVVSSSNLTPRMLSRGTRSVVSWSFPWLNHIHPPHLPPVNVHPHPHSHPEPPIIHRTVIYGLPPTPAPPTNATTPPPSGAGANAVCNCSAYVNQAKRDLMDAMMNMMMDRDKPSKIPDDGQFPEDDDDGLQVPLVCSTLNQTPFNFFCSDAGYSGR